jgi:serine/threonine protein kinase
MLQKGSLLESRYLLAGQIASGGFADIYVASDMRLGNKPVIIKMLRSDFTDDMKRVRMFIDEINLTTFLDHENIVRVYDVLRTGEDSYLQVLELIDGQDMTLIIEEARARREPIPNDLISYILSKVCLALEYAHELKDPNSGEHLSIVHRDISPSNILISYDGKVKLTDFGIAFAHMHQRQKTQMGEIKGKLSYMSPEQVLGQKVDRRSDIYSLGIVMYEILTRERLFEADSDIATMKMVAEGKIDFKPLDDSKAPEPLKEILHKALQKKDSSRYQNAYEMYRGLHEYVSSSDEYTLSNKLKDYLSSMKKETRLTQLLRILKGEGKGMVISEVSLPQKKTEPEKEEGWADEKTIYDLIQQKQGRSRNKVAWAFFTIFFAGLAFAGLDTFYLKKTPVGEMLYNTIYPPNLVVESNPPGAQVYLDGKLLNNVTPFNLTKISPGAHEFRFQYAGYEPVSDSSNILTVEEWRETGSLENQRVTGIFSIPLLVKSNPANASVYIDSEPYQEKTPTTITYPMLSESLHIRLEHEGFEDLELGLNLMLPPTKKVQNWEIKKDRGEEGDGNFQIQLLGKFSTSITVTSLPEVAYLIDFYDELSDTHFTPVTLPLESGKHILRVEKENLIPWEQEITVETGKPESLLAVLKGEVLINVIDTDKKVEKKGVLVKIFNKEGKQVSKGNTPLNDTLEVGNYEARFTAPGGYQGIEHVSFRVPMDKPITGELSRSNPLLTVRVINARSKSPIGDAEVTFKAGNEGTEQSGFTSAKGVFTKRFRPGEISVGISMPGYKESSDRTEKIEWGKDLTMTFQLEPFLKAPLLKNKTPEEAEILLQQMGLKLEVSEVTDPSHQYGVIIEQTPLVGEIVEEGTTIKITVNVMKEVPKEVEVKEEPVDTTEVQKKEPKKKEVKRRRSGE